ncbi:MAG: epoxyqueuosine reductase QueH [Thermoleophilia bacterium]
MKLLLHICCGPCATSTLDHWLAQGATVTGYFHNPNIQPALEYRRRRTGARDLAKAAGLQLVESGAYDPAAWLIEVFADGADGRCRRCIGSRLRATAAEATASGAHAFTTSLAISPWQDHDAIREEGAAAAELHGVEFLYEDLRPLYRDSRTRARMLGLYRQTYCGCLLSEWERYAGDGR